MSKDLIALGEETLRKSEFDGSEYHNAKMRFCFQAAMCSREKHSLRASYPFVEAKTCLSRHSFEAVDKASFRSLHCRNMETAHKGRDGI